MIIIVDLDMMNENKDLLMINLIQILFLPTIYKKLIKTNKNILDLIGQMVKHQDESFKSNDDQGFESDFGEIKQEKSIKKGRKQKSPKKEKSGRKQKLNQNKNVGNSNKLQNRGSTSIKEPSQTNKKRMQQEKNIYEGDSEFQMSQFGFYANPNSGRHSQNNNEQVSSNVQSAEGSQSSGQNVEVSENMLMILMEFFISIQQPNGLVFKSQFRKKLKSMHPDLQMSTQHELDPEGEEIHKIKIQVPQKLIIFNKDLHEVDMTKVQFNEYIREDVSRMTNAFKEASYIFCREVTAQLYDIMRNLCNIVVLFRKDDENMLKALEEFGDSMVSLKSKEHNYFYFGYQFLTFPKKATPSQLLEYENKDKYKYALKSKYRLPGTEFAAFAKKAGLHLRNIIESLKCYQSLK